MEENAIENRRARFDYEILETMQAGIELLGAEAKALKFGRGKIAGAHVVIRGGEAYVIGMDIPPYQPGNMADGYESDRTRKLLLTKEQIGEIAGAIRKSGLTIIPLRVYIKNRLVKIEIGLGRGKKKADKREAVKKREWSRLRRNIETR